VSRQILVLLEIVVEVVRDKPYVALRIVDDLTEDLADLLHAIEEALAFDGRFLAAGDFFKIFNVLYQVACPGAGGRNGVVMQQMLDRRLQNGPGSAHRQCKNDGQNERVPGHKAHLAFVAGHLGRSAAIRWRMLIFVE